MFVVSIVQVKENMKYLNSLKVFIKNIFFEIAHQDKSWVPHSICKNCYAALTHWRNGTRKHLPFDIPMIWGKPRVHKDCYFCAYS